MNEHITDFSFYCILRKSPNFYENAVCICQAEHNVYLLRIMSSFLEISKGVPQGSILAPILFSICINYLGFGIHPAKLHLYADDTVIHTDASPLKQAISELKF